MINFDLIPRRIESKFNKNHVAIIHNKDDVIRANGTMVISNGDGNRYNGVKVMALFNDH